MCQVPCEKTVLACHKKILKWVWSRKLADKFCAVLKFFLSVRNKLTNTLRGSNNSVPEKHTFNQHLDYNIEARMRSVKID